MDIGCFKTKGVLKAEDEALTREVWAIERCYRDVYQFVYQLDIAYKACMEHFVLTRYEELKDMIKACITDEVITRVANNRAINSPQETGRSTNSPQKTGRAVRLHTAAQRLYEASARDEVSGLHKAEIVNDIEEKKKRKEKIQLKFLRLYNRLVKLKNDYEESKQHLPMNRYGVMKEMIQPLIQDQCLRIGST